MTKLEKSGCIIALEYEWKLNDIKSIKEKTVVLSKKINYKNGSFQVGLKKLSISIFSTPKSPNLIFIASNLHKIGLKVESVSYSQSRQRFGLTFPGENKQTMDLKFGTKKLQFFTASPMQLGSSCPTFLFTVYLTGLIENNQIHRMDGLLSKQLLSSTQDTGADFNLIAENGNSFPIHKWMLAARSTVFEALFSDDKNIRQVIMDCNVDVMNQFIKFIYPGKLNGPADSLELMQLATQFEIKTLEDLCRSASKEASLSMITKLIASNLEPGSSDISCVFPV